MFRVDQELSQFVLKQLIYTSKLSQIWQVQHSRNQRLAVIKIALTWKENGHDSFGETANTLIRNEAEILPHLSHPSIVQIYPLQIQTGRVSQTDEISVIYDARAAHCNAEIKPWYFAMKWIEGNPLSDCFQQVMEQTFEWRMELFYQLLVTIEYLHHNGYAHMDLKPENILVTPIKQDQPPRLTLIDLGCASRDLEQMTSEPGGTDQYAPLELLVAMHSQLADENKPRVIPVKVDIWSLGAIFFELIVGEPLFEAGMNALKIRDTMLQNRMRRIAENDALVLQKDKLDKGKLGQLDQYLRLMLQLNPDDRREIGELIQRLDVQISCPPRV